MTWPEGNEQVQLTQALRCPVCVTSVGGHSCHPLSWPAPFHTLDCPCHTVPRPCPHPQPQCWHTAPPHTRVTWAGDTASSADDTATSAGDTASSGDTGSSAGARIVPGTVTPTALIQVTQRGTRAAGSQQSTGDKGTAEPPGQPCGPVRTLPPQGHRAGTARSEGKRPESPSRDTGGARETGNGEGLTPGNRAGTKPRDPQLSDHHLPHPPSAWQRKTS